MEEINFALALNKPHKDNFKAWKVIKGANDLKKLSERFFEKDNKGKITYKELHNFKFDGVDFKELDENQKTVVESISVNSECYGYIDFEPDWRFIVGLGGASIYDTGITLHHIYGIPYIPASSIKGTLRSWYILDKYIDKGIEMEGYAIENETFCKVFGCPKELKINGKSFLSGLKYKGESSEFEGNVIFFDAFPLTVPQLKLDIMNPHYQPYYSDNEGKTPPADYFSPNPIMFLTVEKTVFRMYFGVKKENQKELVEVTKTWLTKALYERGIGAKTSAGYGFSKKSKIQKEKVIKVSKPNYYGDKKLKVGETIEGEIINTGKKANVKLYLKQGETEFTIVNIGYGSGFILEDIGKILILTIKNLHGTKDKPKINPDGFGEPKFK
jgi:CRISPR-associated protein Cmr6